VTELTQEQIEAAVDYIEAERDAWQVERVSLLGQIAQLKSDLMKVANIVLRLVVPQVEERSELDERERRAAAALGLDADHLDEPAPRVGKLEPGRNFLAERVADAQHDRVPKWLTNPH
jgi:hypothetical protein